MVATRDIDPLELILVEEPAVVGPYSKSTNGCLQCFKKASSIYTLSDILAALCRLQWGILKRCSHQVDNSFRCPGCRFPMCNERCTKGDRHRDECEFFKLHEKLHK